MTLRNTDIKADSFIVFAIGMAGYLIALISVIIFS
jgi:hypothetical protein